jgi:hypothetical protein
VLWAAVTGSPLGLLRETHLPELITAWVLLLIGSYVLGHFVAALGSWSMDFLFDQYYKHKYELGANREIPSLRRRADHLLMQTLGERLYREEDNRLTWGESFLLLANPAATAKLDRLEADSKFFRSLAAVAILSELVCFSPLTSWSPAHSRYFALLGIAILLALVALSRRNRPDKTMAERVKERLMAATTHRTRAASDRGRLSWPDEQWLQAERDIRRQDAQRTHPYALLLPTAWLLYCVMTAYLSEDRNGWFAALLCWILTILAVARFINLRVKRLELAYYLTIALHKEKQFAAPSSEEP